MVVITNKTTNTWLKNKIDHYIKVGDNETAIRFAEKYGPEVEGFHTALEIQNIQKQGKKPKQPKIKPKKEVKGIKEEKGDD